MAENSYAALTPSQAMGGSSTSTTTGRTRTRRRRNKATTTSSNAAAVPSKEGTNGNEVVGSSPDHQPQKQPQPPKQGNNSKRRIPNTPKPQPTSDAVTATGNGGCGGDKKKAEPPNNDSADTGPKVSKGRRRNRGRGRNNIKDNEAKNAVDQKQLPVVGEVAVTPAAGNQPPEGAQDGKKENKRSQKNNNNKNKQRKKYPWRRFIPTGTVDPITLESLMSLEYPPFALVANAPYETVRVWPIPENGSEEAKNSNDPKEDIEELNRKRIAEQWGKSFEGDQQTKPSPTPVDPTKRHYNLYDGRALAYYIVSQLQFIDPLNRRDLTRDELLNLDGYLKRHGFKDLNVTEAYDAKGVTISSAGAVAATAQGRADIMQQMARNLLNSLFVGHSVAAATPVATDREELSELQQQYAAHQRQEPAQDRRPRQTEPGRSESLDPYAAPYYHDNGVYTSGGGGLMVIDDDENPGMRGGNYDATPGSQIAASGYSASHITARYGSGVALDTNTDSFPALPTTSSGPSPGATTAKATLVNNVVSNSSKPPSKPSKTLARITGAVKKTNPEEAQRQWEAREAARNRAMLANMSFGVDASIINIKQNGLLQPPSATSLETPSNDVSDEKLQRNMAFADALGIQPATVRRTINSGWARPTDAKVRLDEFRNELNAAIYPDSFVFQARERMGLLIKIEKKWKAFLQDNKAASLSMYPMDKPSRAFFHQYSDFWNLKTESFDPEPQRYIHCVKLMDTHTPHPLLSDVARRWTGPPVPIIPTGPSYADHSSQQTAGQPSESREIPDPPGRVHLSILPRALAPVGADMMGNVDPPETRFGSLVHSRERPKIELAKRTIPLELPPLETSTKAYDMNADLKERKSRQEEKARREKAAKEQKQRAIEQAFASDDEEAGGVDRGSESDWEEPEAEYQGSDSEE